MSKRDLPTIAELEATLMAEGEMSIEILPNGEVRAIPSTEVGAGRQEAVERIVRRLCPVNHDGTQVHDTGLVRHAIRAALALTDSERESTEEVQRGLLDEAAELLTFLLAESGPLNTASSTLAAIRAHLAQPRRPR